MKNMKQKGPTKGAKNEADTGSVVGKVKGSISHGKMRQPTEKARSMVAGNANLRKKK